LLFLFLFHRTNPGRTGLPVDENISNVSLSSEIITLKEETRGDGSGRTL
jgi:hypothetical protein